MVIGDKNMEDYVGLRTGRRSLGPSPSGNGHIGLSDDSSASDDSDSETGMRVGTEYQAFIPICNPGMKLSPRAEAMLVWAPHPEQTEAKIDEYISISKEKHGYNTEQALGMLFWHKHKIDKALADLPNFTPFPDEWTVEDKVLYEQAFSFHGKSFHRIRQMLPDKSIAQLVKYYYSWKKTRTRTSLMDRQARKLANHHGDSDNEAVGSGNSDSDMETGRELKEEIRHTYLRPAPGAKKTDPHGRAKNRRRPPRGMYINHDDLHAIATGPPGQGEAILKQLDAELVTLKRQVQNNKQLLSMYKLKTHSGIDSYRPPEPPNRINARWTNEELLLAVQGVRKYGKDFRAISEVIGNKTEAHLRSFFVNYRRRYNLDEILAEYEVECGTSDTHKDEPNEKMEVDLVEEDTAKPNSSPEENNTTQNGTTSAPPPLVKQAPTLLQSPLRQPPPLQQQAPRSTTGVPVTTAPSRSVLQQPPPLIRPNSNSVPIMSRLKPTGSTSAPQIANRD